MDAKTTIIVHTANGPEEVSGREQLAPYSVEGDPVVIRFDNGEVIEYWQGNGGHAPSYDFHESGILGVYAGGWLVSYYSPSAWRSVNGPLRSR